MLCEQDELRVVDIGVNFGSRCVLKGVNIRVGSGQAVALLGENGQGKSTLLKAIMGLIPAEGNLFFAGTDLTGLSPLQLKKIGIVYAAQSAKVFPSLSVEENIYLPVIDGERGSISSSVDSALRIFPELKSLLKHPAGLLSGGQQQMVSIARALCQDPKVLLLDEPSVGLTDTAWSNISAAIRRAVMRGLALLVVEHQTRRLASLADYAYVLQNGKIITQGSWKEISGAQ